MSIEENKALARTFLEAHAPDKLEALHEILSPDLVWKLGDETDVFDREGYIQGVEAALQAFSDPVFRIVESVAEGEKVALRYTMGGRYTGEMLGIAPTGQQIKFTTIGIYRITDGKIVELWITNGSWPMLHQLGALP